MIHDLISKVDPTSVVKKLNAYNWSKFPTKRTNVVIFQNFLHGEMQQVIVPLDKNFSDFRFRILDAIRHIAKEEEYPSEEYVILELVGEDNAIEYITVLEETILEVKSDLPKNSASFLHTADKIMRVQTDAEKIMICAVKNGWKEEAINSACKTSREAKDILEHICEKTD